MRWLSARWEALWKTKIIVSKRPNQDQTTCALLKETMVALKDAWALRRRGVTGARGGLCLASGLDHYPWAKCPVQERRSTPQKIKDNLPSPQINPLILKIYSSIVVLQASNQTFGKQKNGHTVTFQVQIESSPYSQVLTQCCWTLSWTCDILHITDQIIKLPVRTAKTPST